jgi:hypothetical protein
MRQDSLTEDTPLNLNGRIGKLQFWKIARCDWSLDLI